MRKLLSFCKYIRLFRNWWIAAGARYLRARLGAERQLHLRSGGSFEFVPASDFIAVGEIFVAEVYRPVTALASVRLVWDVGGNIGCFVLWASRYLPGAQFHSFEPASQTFDRLRRNQQSNPSIAWQVHPFGFSSKDEVCEARTPKGMAGETSRFAAEGEAVRLELRDINRYWHEQGRPVVDILKIDCEGGEHDIFDRIWPDFMRCVRSVIMEVHTVPGRDLFGPVAALEQCGFTVDRTPVDQGNFLAFARRGGEGADVQSRLGEP